MKKAFLLLMLCLASSMLWAQDKKVIDSLLQVLETDISSEERVETYLQLTRRYVVNDTVEAYSYATLAYQLADKEGDFAAETLALDWIAYLHRNQYDTAIQLYTEVAIRYQEAADSGSLAQTYLFLGSVYKREGVYEQALEYYFLSKKIFEEIHNQYKVGIVLERIAEVKREEGKYEEALEYFLSSEKVFELLKHDFRLSRVSFLIARLHQSQGSYEAALQYYLKVEEISKKNENSEVLGWIYRNIADLYEEAGSPQLSYDHLLKCLEVIRRIDNRQAFINVYYSIAIKLRDLGDYRQALEYHFQAISISEELGLHWRTADNYNSIGTVYCLIGELDKALEYHKKALDIWADDEIDPDQDGSMLAYGGLGLVYMLQEQYQMALECYNKGSEIAFRLDDKTAQMVSYSRLGNIYYRLSEVDRALEYHRKARAIINEFDLLALDDHVYVVEAHLSLSNLYYDLGQYQKAKTELQSAIRLASKYGLIADHLDALELLVEIEDRLGNYEAAYAYQKRVSKLSDSANVENRRFEVALMEVENTYKQEKDSIQFANEKLELASAQAFDRQRNILIVGVVGFTVLAIILIILYRYYVLKQKSNKRLIALNQEIQDRNQSLEDSYTVLKELDQYKEGMTAMIVHDFKNALNTVINFSEGVPSGTRLRSINQAGKFMLNMAMNILDVQKFEETSIKLGESVNPVSKVVKEAIKQLQYMIEQKSITLEYQLETAIHTRMDYELYLRVLVNIISNAIKFTPQNGVITISASQRENDVVLSVQDTGPGIPEDRLAYVFDKFSQVEEKKSGLARSTGIGLTFCKMVVEAHGKDIWVESREGEGATFYFTMPFAEGSAYEKVEEVLVDKGHEVNLTSEEWEAVSEEIARMNGFEVYDYSDVKQVLDSMEVRTDNVKQWREELYKSIKNGNEVVFNSLLRRVSHQ